MARDRPNAQRAGHSSDVSCRCRRCAFCDTRTAAHDQRAAQTQETTMTTNKPLAPWLPGRYGRMTRDELDAESNRYDREFSATRAKRVPNTRPHPKKRGRPAKPPCEKAARVLITMTPSLLAAADA